MKTKDSIKEGKIRKDTMEWNDRKKTAADKTNNTTRSNKPNDIGERRETKNITR